MPCDFFKKGSDIKKGFTLIELVFVMGVVAVLIVMSMNVLGIFSKAGAKGVSLYQAQTDVRRSVSVVTDTLRNAGSIYLLPEKLFNASKNQNLSLSYNYIGVEKLADGRSQLVKYVLNAAGTGHDRSVIAESAKDGAYKLGLGKDRNKDAENENLIDLKVICEIFGVEPQEIDTSLRAMNAGFIVDWSGGSDAVAIAYTPNKTDVNVTRQQEVKGGAAIYMVLDNSGSMKRTLTNYSSNTIANWRAYHLRVACKKFIDRISVYDHVYVGIQGFDSSAPLASHKALMNLSEPASQAFLSNLFDANYFESNYWQFTEESSRYTEILHAVGGTNMGDGFRKAYWHMLSETQMLGIQEYNKYITFVSDGEPTALTVLSNAPDTTTNISSYFYYGDKESPMTEYFLDYVYMYGYYPFDYPYLNGLKTDYIDYDSRPPDYANAVAKMIRDSGEFKDSFLIAIGELNLSTLNSIANSLGIPNSDFSSHVFKANDELNFYIAVESIAESISVEIEEVLGAELLQNAQD